MGSLMEPSPGAAEARAREGPERIVGGKSPGASCAMSAVARAAISTGATASSISERCSIPPIPTIHAASVIPESSVNAGLSVSAITRRSGNASSAVLTASEKRGVCISPRLVSSTADPGWESKVSSRLGEASSSLSSRAPASSAFGGGAEVVTASVGFWSSPARAGCVPLGVGV